MLLKVQNNGTDATPSEVLNLKGATFTYGTDGVPTADFTTIPAGTAVTAPAGAGSWDYSLATGIFKTPTGANTLSGNTTLAAGKNLTGAAGAGAVDLSAMTGTFKTPTGAHDINGTTTFAANKNLLCAAGTSALDFSLGTGVFKTPTGAATHGGTTNTIAPPVATSGVPTALTITGAADTAQTASTEKLLVNVNGARTVQWATGALTTQREVLVQAPTYAFVGASTLTNAATLAISGAPVAGANATITNKMALWVQDGAVNLADATVSQTVNINTGVTINGASGVITTQSATTAAVTAEAGFTVTNSAVLAGSIVVAKVSDYSGTLMTNGIPEVSVTSVSAGSFAVKVMNLHAVNALSGTMKIRFAVL